MKKLEDSFDFRKNVSIEAQYSAVNIICLLFHYYGIEFSDERKSTISESE